MLLKDETVRVCSDYRPGKLPILRGVGVAWAPRVKGEVRLGLPE